MTAVGEDGKVGWFLNSTEGRDFNFKAMKWVEGQEMVYWLKLQNSESETVVLIPGIAACTQLNPLNFPDLDLRSHVQLEPTTVKVCKDHK